MIDPATFLPTTETAVPIVTPPGGGRAVGVLGGRTIFRVLSEQTGGAYAIIEQEIPVGHGPPLHVHRRETEVFYILEGDFELTVGDQKLAAPVGTSAACPRDVPHTFRNVGATPGRIMVTIIPGRFGDYFLDVDQVDDHEIETIRRLCAKYDVELLV
ncbi:MAG: cupin domain-containing protein [Planctomycetia bacterium]